MLARLLLEVLDRPAPLGRAGALSPVLARLQEEFPAVALDAAGWGAAVAAPMRLAARDWAAPVFDLAAFDRCMSALADRGAFTLCLSGEAARIERVAREVLTRGQRLSPRRNQASRGALFDAVLARHRALHDLDKPLVRADHDHARDTWQWVLRLSPDAGLAVQAAALFHDIERLVSEADARVEHHAPDYLAFKEAHAARGAHLARGALAEAGLAGPELERAAELIARHEQPGGDPELGAARRKIKPDRRRGSVAVQTEVVGRRAP